MHRSSSFARRQAVVWLSLALGGACFAAAAAEPAPASGNFDAAMRDCAAEQGLSAPEPGQRPDDNKRPNRQKMDECLAAKGFKSPAKGKRPPPPEDDELW